MKQSEAKEFLPLIKAWSEGKTLQYRCHEDCPWNSVDEGLHIHLNDSIDKYRIKPEPREFWVCQDKGTGHHKAVYNGPIGTEEGREVIHVREVLND